MKELGAKAIYGVATYILAAVKGDEGESRYANRRVKVGRKSSGWIDAITWLLIQREV